MRMVESRIKDTKESELISQQAFYLRLVRIDQEGDIQRDIYATPCCNGAGYVRKERPVGHPDFGGYLPCPACQRRKQDMAEPAKPWAR